MEKEEKKLRTEIYNLIILDKSGSMTTIANAAIGGFNETVGGIRAAQKQYEDSQKHFVSLFTFCNCSKDYVYENVPVEDVKTLTSKEYMPCCGTPLYDAMGISLNRLLKQIKDLSDATAVVTVITDGMENASKEYSGAAIKALVEKLQKEEGWNFSYIGTNQDVDKVAVNLSIHNTLYFEDTQAGMSDAWEKERKSRSRMFGRLQELRSAAAPCMSAGERKKMRSVMNESTANYRSMDEFKHRVSPSNIDTLKENEIFVFGSNKEGMHGGGAARAAVKKYGAIMGQGVGLQGRSYAIPTMDGSVKAIAPYVDEFILFAKEHSELTFLVTAIGCGIAGYTPKQIAPLFVQAVDVDNIHLPVEFWREII